MACDVSACVFFYFSQCLFSVLPHKLCHLLSFKQHCPNHELTEWVLEHVWVGDIPNYGERNLRDDAGNLVTLEWVEK